MDAVKLLGSLLNNNSTGGNILGSLLGAARGGGGSQGGSGLDVGGILGSLMGGGGSRSSAGGGGMGGNIAGAVLGSLLGGRSGGSGGGGGGGMMDMLGGLMGGGGQGGASGLLSGGATEAAAAPQHATPAPTADPNAEAELLIRAMCNAAKSDGKFDEAEQKAILGRLGDDVDQAEMDFINSELSKPLDVQSFVSSVPAGLAQQTYAFSVMAIKIDEQSEARYLGELAQGLGIDPASCNQIHEQLGAPKIFS